MQPSRRARTGLALVAAAATVVPVLGLAGPASAVSGDRTSAKEAARVDRVKVHLAWSDCSDAFGPRAQCATAKLPLDYDRPNGATTSVALLRIRAAKPAQRVGSLFVNPGGPGGSGVEIAAAAPFFLSSSLNDRFDVVGFDPRGTNFSQNVECWQSGFDQLSDLSGLNVSLPDGKKQNAAAVRSAKAWGRACSTTGRPLSGSMSTAEVARDMDVLRRAVGDKKLTYLGFSYGTYLGQVYANLFPDRVRSVVIDGVLDPVAWAGTSKTAGVPQTARLKSGEGADKALHEILARCDKAGPKFCRLAALGDPQTLFDGIVARAKKGPITLVDPQDPTFTFTLTYGDIYSVLLGTLYDQFGAGDGVDQFVTSLVTSISPDATPAARTAAVRTVRDVRARLAARTAKAAPTAAQRRAFGQRFGYDNSPEAFASVLCTDGLNPRSAANWPAYAAANGKKAPGFGPLWTWSSAQCAASTWTVRDEDRYAGAFTHRTAHPVLVVGDFYDPATNYAGAVTASKLLPNSRLLSSDSFGHTAYGTSECATVAVDNYLLTGALPARGTLCVGPQPFTTPLQGGKASVQSVAPKATRTGARPAPIAPFVPGAGAL